jgi:hypothetical protein
MPDRSTLEPSSRAGWNWTVQATDPDAGDSPGNWNVKGGSGAYKSSIDSATGVLSIADPSAIDYAGTSTCDLTVLVGDGKLPSHDATVTITIPSKLNVCHNGHTISISKGSAHARCPTPRWGGELPVRPPFGDSGAPLSVESGLLLFGNRHRWR